MELFESHIRQTREFLEKYRSRGLTTEYRHSGPTSWPPSHRRSLVLAADTGGELGHPQDASTSFLLCTNRPETVPDRRITVVGPDLPEMAGRRSSFGRIVVAAGRGFNQANCLDRCREMNLLKYDMDLSGYMLRAVSGHQREWSRVCREALEKGFSFEVLGGAAMEQLAALAYVEAAEIIFITQSRQAVMEAKMIGDETMKIIGAMHKMTEELDFDCQNCDYSEVCRSVAELRRMRKNLARRRAAEHV